MYVVRIKTCECVSEYVPETGRRAGVHRISYNGEALQDLSGARGKGGRVKS